MRKTVFMAACLFASVGWAVPNQAQEKNEQKPNSDKSDSTLEKVPLPIEQAKWNVSYLEKTAGVKVKSISLFRPKNQDDRESLQLLCEYTKDVSKSELEKNSVPRVYFYFFDDDNVLVSKYPTPQSKFDSLLVEGIQTGKQGDAFRLCLNAALFSKRIAKATKVELRGE